MKQTLETSEEKIGKIGQRLRYEIIEPAQEDARKIIEEAKKQAERLIKEAEQNVEKMSIEGRKAIEQERNVFQSSLSQAVKQSLEALRQAIERKLFNQQLHELVTSQTSNPQIIAELIRVIVKAVEKEGLKADINAIIPANIPAREVNQLLAEETLKKLKDQGVSLGDFLGGVKIRLENQKVTIDISNAEIEELLQRYLRKDYRKLLFAE